MTPLSRAHHLFPLLCLALTAWAFHPGHVSFDSAYQFWQVRTGNYSNVSPVAMTYLWSLLNRVWPGSGGIFFLNILMFWSGVWLIACTLYSRPAHRVAATLLVAGVSPALMILSHIWTDATLIACLTLASGLILRAGHRRERLPLYCAIPLLVYGGLVRHNALPALIPLLAWWLVVLARTGSSQARLPAMKLLAAVLVACLAVFGLGHALDSRLVVHRVSTIGIVQVWDLAGVSLSTGTMLLPDFVRPADVTLDQLREKYSRYTSVPLYAPPHAIRDGLSIPFTPSESRRLREAWLDAVRQHPVAYAGHRLAVTTALFNRYRNDRPSDLGYIPYMVQYKDNPVIAPNDSSLHRMALAWYEVTVGWWISAPAPYILLAIGCALVAWRRRSDFRGELALATAVSGLLYVAPLPLVAPSAELRYSGWLFAAATISLISLIALAAARRRNNNGSAPASSAELH